MKSDHLFAWGGISLRVPDDWNLASYQFTKDVSRVVLEDDFHVRMELEWMSAGPTTDMMRVRKRYAKYAKPLSRDAKRVDDISLPSRDWQAQLYVLPGDTRLVTAFYLAPDKSILAFFRIYFTPTPAREPWRVLEAFAESFRYRGAGMVPWAYYDVQFEMPAEFTLEATALQSGRKMLAFQHRMRKFYVWHISLADILLRDVTLAEWAAAFLNGFKKIRGARFEAEGRDTLRAHRARRFRLGNYDEIGRWCFRYEARCVHDTEKNRIVLTVFNYRRESDRQWVRPVYASLLA